MSVPPYAFYVVWTVFIFSINGIQLVQIIAITTPKKGTNSTKTILSFWQPFLLLFSCFFFSSFSSSFTSSGKKYVIVPVNFSFSSHFISLLFLWQPVFLPLFSFSLPLLILFLLQIQCVLCLGLTPGRPFFFFCEFPSFFFPSFTFPFLNSFSFSFSH